jgi:translocation and assembly module TamB
VRVPGALADALGTFGLTGAHDGELQFRVHADSLPALARYVRLDTGLVAARPGIAARQREAARRDSAVRATAAAVAIAAGDVAPPKLDSVPDQPSIPRDSLSGTVYAAGSVRGNIKLFDARGRGGAVDLVAFGNAVKRARVAFNWLGGSLPEWENGTMAVAAVADSVRTGGFQLDSVDVRATYRKPGGDLQFAVYQTFKQDLTGRLAYAIYPDRREARFDQLRMRIDTVLWASARPGSVYWGQPGVEVDNIELTNGLGGRIFADGRLPSEGPADLRLEVTRFDVGNALSVLESDVPFHGFVTMDARLTGTGRAPVIAATASVDSANYKGTALPDVRARIDYANTRLTGTADLQSAGRSLATATGALPINLAFQGATGPRIAADATATVDARADSLPLAIAGRFTDAVSNVAGYARGTFSLRGPLKKPVISGDVALNDAEFRIVAAGITMRDVFGSVKLRGDTVVIDSVAGQSRGRIAVRGGIGIRDMARPSFDVRLLAENARVLDNEQGRVDADAQISAYGPFDGLFVSGGARVRRGVIYIPEPDHKEVVSAGDPAVFAVIDTTRLGNKDLVAAQSPLLANLSTDVFVGIERDTWVRSREANVEIYSDGDLRLRVNRAKQALVLDGIVSTDRGEYTFMSKRFQVKRGSATFVGTQELNPSLQATAEYEVAQAGREPLVIRIVIGGNVKAPTIALESDAQPPIPQSDLISYLAFGSNTGQLLSFGGGSSVAGGTAGGNLVGATAALASRQLASVATGVLVDQLESRTARSLGADVFNITPVPGLPDELAGGNLVGGFRQFLTGTQVEFGKYFNPQLFVAFQSTPVFFEGDPPIPGFRVQYRFRRWLGLSVESTYQPRYFLPPPSLEAVTIDPKNALGLYLVRQWRF